LVNRDRKRFMQRLFGGVKVAQQADQRREHLARVGAVDGVHYFAHLFGCVVVHDRQTLFTG